MGQTFVEFITLVVIIASICLTSFKLMQGEIGTIWKTTAQYHSEEPLIFKK